MASSPPLTSSAKTLYEEGDTHDGLTVWSPSHAYRHRSSTPRRRICFAIIFGLLMFLLGVSVGAFLYASIYPYGNERFFQLSFLRSQEDNETSSFFSYTDDGVESNSRTKETTFVLSSSKENDDEVEYAKDDQTHSSSEEDLSSQNLEEKKTRKKSKRIEKVRESNTVSTGTEADEVDENFLSGNKECSNTSWYSSRLPRTLIPNEYVLTLQPDLETGVVNATVLIRMKSLSNTKLLVLNAENLDMHNYTIIRKGLPLKAEFAKCEVMTQWAWKLSKTIKKDDHIELQIDYRIQMKSDLQGLYLSTHVLPDGQKKRSAATQFEPTFARKMLPCFDEPNFKARFQVFIIRKPDHIARSNMNLLVSKEHRDGLIIDEFEKSVKMSTYLLAVAVLDGYNYVKRYTKNTTKSIEVRLYAPSDMLKGQSEFGLNTTIRALEFFEHYFNISYPLDKIDLLALDDFSEGAMENWGLVTFRDSALLFNEEKASVVAKEHIALIICHEIAHQWFGNLVTMDWWNEVFLNEGFANYMEYKCADELFPDWSIMTRFYAENLAFSQDPDGFLSSREIESDDDDSLLNLFDAINYHKAAAIIHMIAEMAGQKNFQAALIEYLNKYAYDNAKGADLWKIVEKHANLQGRVSIPDLAKAYTTQVGYPLITVKKSEDVIQVFNQTRFVFTEGVNAKTGTNDHKWPIPINYRTKTEDNKKLHWLNVEDNNVSFEVTPSDWIILNTGGVGYFKVLYDDNTYKTLIKQLSENHTVISAVDRSMLLVDAYDLSRTSLLNITTYFDIIQYAEKEDDKMTWSIISKQLRVIESLIEDSDYLDLFQDFQRSLIMRLYESLDWDEKGAPPNQKKLQIEAFGVACRLRIKDCTKQAYQRYLKWISNSIRNPEHHLISLLEGVKQGGTTAWNRIWNAYKTAVSPSEKNNIIGALTSTRDVSLINKIMKYCLDGRIKANLIPRVLSGFSLNQVGRNAAWKFFKNHFTEFHMIMGKTSTLMSSCVKCLAEPISTKRELDELKEFLKAQKFEEDSQVKMGMTFEQIELNIQWRNLNEAQLGKWIELWDERRRTLYRKKRHRHTSHRSRSF